MNKKRKNTIQQNEISQIFTFDLGGYPQKILIEGKSKKLPVVITLHGGPGTPIPFSVGCRGMFPEFTDNFIMVYWDQLGCGINNYIIDDSFKISSFVDMTCDLVRKVRDMFKENNIYIFATSWGSVLSALAAKSMQDIISGVVANGQIIKDLFFNDEIISVLEQSRIPPKKLEILKNTTLENATSKELKLMSSCLTKYSNAYNNANGKKAPMLSTIMGLLTSPDYHFKDFKAIMMNGYKNNTSIWSELLRIDLTDTLSGIGVPYVIIQGDTDIVASTQKVIELVEASSNDHLKYHVVKNSGHFPNVDAMNKILEELKIISR